MSGFRWITVIIPVLFLISPPRVNAQVVINEVLPNPSGADDGAEWVELFNTGGGSVASLENCVLYLHGTDNNQKVEFGQEDFVDKFKVISWDGSWLNNNGDTVRFVCNAGSESISYGDVEGSAVTNPGDGISFGRTPDGSGGFTVLSSLTMGFENSLPPTNTPKPTDFPPATQKPTSTPVPTKNPLPSLVTVKSQIPKNASGNASLTAVSATQTPEESHFFTNFAGANESPENPEIRDSTEAQVLSARAWSGFPILPVVFSVPGILIMSYFVIRVIRSFKKRYRRSS